MSTRGRLLGSLRPFRRKISTVVAHPIPPYKGGGSPRRQTNADAFDGQKQELLNHHLRSSRQSRQHSFFAQSEKGESADDEDEAVIVAQAEKFLSYLLKNEPERVDTEDYLVVLRHLATCKLPDAALRAERWLARLERQCEKDASSTEAFARVSAIVPTSECYQRVIETWAFSTSEDPVRAVTRAERWLMKMRESESPQLRPDTACFNAFLDVCTRGRALKGSSRGSKRANEHAQKAENTLRYMIAQTTIGGSAQSTHLAPNVESFNLVIRGWTRCRTSVDIVDRAMTALSLLENYHENVDPHVRPNSKSYGMIMDAISVRAKLKVKRCSPRYRDDPAANGVEEITLLRNMIDFFEAKQKAGDPLVGPSTYAYNTLLAGWASMAALNEQATTTAEAILRHMITQKDAGQDVGPDAISYGLVIKAWKNSGKPLRGQSVTWLLAKMWKDYEFAGDACLQPTTQTYNTVMGTWTSLQNPLEAEKVMVELMEKSKLDQSGQLRANSESFSILIRAWLALAVKGSEGALRNAAKWMNTVAELERNGSGISSSVELYTNFFGAARKCAPHDPQTLDLVLDIFNQLQTSHHKMECLHFSRLLQVGLLTLSRPERSEERSLFIEKVITETKEHGLVSSPLLQALATGPVYLDGWTIDASKDMCEEHFPSWPLPPSWTRNVKQGGMLARPSDLVRRDLKTMPKHGVDPYENQY